MDFIDLKSQYKEYKKEIDKEIFEVLNSASFIGGEKVLKLEEKLSDFVESKYAISCSSGTDALLLSLLALDIKENDEVITTPFTFIATAEVISLLKAKPVFVDIDEKTYNIDVKKIEDKITSKTKAIIAVSLFGQPCDLDELNRVIKKEEGRREKGEGRREKEEENPSAFNLQPSTSNLQPSTSKIYLIVDGAQSFGATYKNRSEIHYCDIYTTSFFPSKPLGCYGDGGAIFTNDEKIAKKISMLKNHGQRRRYEHDIIGLNARLDAIQAAVLLVKLKYFPYEIEKRVEIAQRYTKFLRDYVITPYIKEDRSSVYAQYSIRVKNRKKLIESLKKESIPTAIHYPKPLHLQKAFEYLGYKEGDFPISEMISKEILSIPMSPFLKIEDQDFIIEKIIESL